MKISTLVSHLEKKPLEIKLAKLRLFTLLFASSLAVNITALNSAAFADEELEKGKAIYNGIGACASCHGPIGMGDGPAAVALTPKPRSFVTGEYSFDTDSDGKKGTEVDIFNVVSNGAIKYGGSAMMAARADIPEADRKALVKYVMSLKK